MRFKYRFNRLFAAVALLFPISGVCQVAFQFSGSGVATPPGAVWIVSADFNGDDNVDVATANAAAESVSVYLGNGDGSFRAAVSYPAPSGCRPNYLAVGDFNNDHKIDLLASCAVGNTLYVLPGQGNGAFGQAVMTQLSQAAVLGNILEYFPNGAVADFNSDGNLDLILESDTNADPSDLLDSTKLVVLLGRGDGSFQGGSQPVVPGGQFPFQITSADFNGDGKPDLAVVAIGTSPDGSGGFVISSAALQIGINDGKGNFSFLAPLNLSGLPSFSMVAGDINGDGKTDIVLDGPSLTTTQNSIASLTTGVLTLLGRGDGTFTQTPVLLDQPGAILATALALSDVRSTGRPDLVAAGVIPTGDTFVGAIAIYQNNGDGTMQPATTFAEGSGLAAFSMTVADLNGDGRPDVIPLTIPKAALQNIAGGGAPLAEVQQTLAQLPAATIQFVKNQTLPPAFTDANAATYATGPLATSSIVAAFGAALATSTASAATLPLPTSLGGASIAVTDSLGVTRAAPLFYASPSQVNFAIPDGTATGASTIAITTSAGTLKVTQQIVATSGGIFNASNLAVADVFTYNGGPVPVVTETFAVNSQGALVPAPINVGPGSQQVYLILFGTGVRNHTGAVTATIGTTTVPVAFAGAQGAYVGEDQINILLPQSLRGAGLVNLTLNVDGQVTNAVQIQIQ
jgi:uncharacterized protein (TIGR03437 family)